MPHDELPEVVELFECIHSLSQSAIPFEGTVVRSAGVRFASESDFLSGQGASFCGGRWNPRGIRAVYASCDIETATSEAYQNFLDYGFGLEALRPRVMAAIAVRLNVVLDLTNRAVRRRLGFTLADLLEEDWQGIQSAGDEAWTQSIGRGCQQAGMEGLLAPSARHRQGRNLVIFPDCLHDDSELTTLGASDMPP